MYTVKKEGAYRKKKIIFICILAFLLLSVFSVVITNEYRDKTTSSICDSRVIEIGYSGVTPVCYSNIVKMEGDINLWES